MVQVFAKLFFFGYLKLVESYFLSLEEDDMWLLISILPMCSLVILYTSEHPNIQVCNNINFANALRDSWIRIDLILMK